MQRNLKDKVVWITGAGGGMGQHIALTLSKLHSKVILSDFNSSILGEPTENTNFGFSPIKIILFLLFSVAGK